MKLKRCFGRLAFAAACVFALAGGGAPPAATIVVETNHASARFTITAEADSVIQGQGLRWEVAVFEGQYTIVYDDISGFSAPPPETRQVVPPSGCGVTERRVHFTGVYVPEPEPTF